MLKKPIFEPVGHRNSSPSRGRLDAHNNSEESLMLEESPPLYGGVIQTCVYILQWICLLFLPWFILAEEHPIEYGMSSNPGAVNTLIGTGDLGRLMHIPARSGVRLGGLWIADGNALLHGIAPEYAGDTWSFNNVVILGLYINFEKALKWRGFSFGTAFLQFNGQPTNQIAGVVQGYNSLPGASPLNRSELYQLWIRQSFLDNRLSFRIGKMIPTYHFNNVSKPTPKEDLENSIPSVTGLIYTPIFVNPTLLGAIGGFYNSVYGAFATVAPTEQSYINAAIYDGNVARGVQTGLTGPHFNGYYFSIAEMGYGWTADKPGIAALGGWYQSGILKTTMQQENGTGGIYGFASQNLWKSSYSPTNLSGFLQFGWNNSVTLNMNLFAGGGLTGFAIIPSRPQDSFGIGLSWARLNKYLFSRYSEFMLQGYYQAQVYRSIYFQLTFSYVPDPGANPTKSNVSAISGRLSTLF